MKILIDGYNLLHVAGILGRSMGRGSLERARLALLNRLSNLLDPNDRKETVVVFDAKDAPRHLPTELVHKDITVRFARDFEEADDLLEYLIRTHSSPRRLMVVSSDHRVQRAAKRRKAKTNDSEPWLNQLQLRAEKPQTKKPFRKPSSRDLDAVEVAEWMTEFGFDFQTDLEETRPEKDNVASLAPPADAKSDAPPNPTEASPTPVASQAPDRSLESQTPSRPKRASQEVSGSNPDNESRNSKNARPKNLKDKETGNPFPQEYLDELKDLEELF